MNASDVLVECLLEWGVEMVFGLPGDGINGVMESLRSHQDKIRFIQVRHEESAAFMACAYAKYTGKLGVCLATSGPGGIHLLNGLYDAKMDGAPVLAITGLQFHDLTGTFTQQDVALDKLFMDVCVYNERIMGATHVENVVDLACRTALSYRGVAHVTIPVDFQEQEVHKRDRSKRNVKQHTSSIGTRSYRIPDEDELKRAAEILNQGKKVAILAGAGALGAGDFVEALADLLGAPIVKALLGKAVVPDDSPFTTGSIGLLGTKPSQEVMEDCDTLLMVGTSFPYIEYLPKPGQAKGVQIDVNPIRIGLRYPVEVGLVGDSRVVLESLTPLLKRKEDRSFLESAQKGMKEWWDVIRTPATRMDKPMKPQVVAWELGQRLRDDAIVSCDSGTIATWFAREIPVKRGQMHSLSGTLATMAPGLPYAIAAQLAYPILGSRANSRVSIRYIDAFDWKGENYRRNSFNLFSFAAPTVGSRLARLDLYVRQAVDFVERCRSEEKLRNSEGQLRAISETLDQEVQTRTKELAEKNIDLSRQSEQVRELSYDLLRTQDEERRHIARELHDSAGQTLTAIGLSLNQTIRDAFRAAPPIAKRLEETQSMVQQLHREIRTTSYLLHPPLLDESGVSSALNWYVEGFSERSGIAVSLDVSEKLGRLPGEVELAIFRVVQESLTNIHRHSGSNTAFIRALIEGQQVHIEISDQGKGMSLERLTEINGGRSGVGIRGMHERLRGLGGQVSVEANAAGTRVVARIPLPKETANSQIDPFQAAI